MLKLSSFRKLSFALFMSILALGGPARAAIISFSPSNTTIMVGNQGTVDITVSGLETGEAVGGFDLNVVFDPALLVLNQVNFGSALGMVNIDQFTSSIFGLGRIDFAAVSLADESTLLGLQIGTFMLAQLVFDSVGSGTSKIMFDAFTPPGLLLSDQFGNAIAITANNEATVRVDPAVAVPEPTTLPLLVLGILLIVGRNGRTARRASSSNRPLQQFAI